MTSLNYGISVTPSTINVLPTYIKNWHISTADLVIDDQSTHASELAYIKSLNLIPRIDIEMVIWAGGQIQDPLSDYSGYLTSLKSAGWTNVCSEGGRPGDATYIKSKGLGYVNYNCEANSEPIMPPGITISVNNRSIRWPSRFQISSAAGPELAASTW